jgi:hypothetical protein
MDEEVNKQGEPAFLYSRKLRKQSAMAALSMCGMEDNDCSTLSVPDHSA